MTPILATVLNVDKQGNEYVVTVQLGNDDFSGPLEKLSFENKPDQGWCHYGLTCECSLQHSGNTPKKRVGTILKPLVTQLLIF